MFKNQSKIPIEGDLLFEKRSYFQNWSAQCIISGTLTFLYLYTIVDTGYSKMDWFQHFCGSIAAVYFILVSILVISILKQGIKDETYEGFYFPDKIILYRISNHVDEVSTEKKSKEELLKEIIILKDEINKMGDDNFMKVFKKIALHNKEEGVIIADNLRKPHKFILEYKDIKYLLSIKGGIKIVKEDQNEISGDSIRFYNELFLTKKYKKNQSEIVEFLNGKVQECKNNITLIK
jgi:hypothetical protein